MKSDLSKVKLGDSIWTIADGLTTVNNICKYSELYPIETNKSSFGFNGKRFNSDRPPSAFLTNPFEGLVPKVWKVKGDIYGWNNKTGIPINGKFYVESGWNEWTDIEQPTVTELSYQQIADKFNVDVNTLKIKK